TGDAARHIQLGRDLLARLTDLAGVRVPARVDGGARGTDRRAEAVGELLHLGEVASSAASTGDHDGGLGELRATGRRLLLRLHDLGGLGNVGDAHVDGGVRRGAGSLFGGGRVRLDG